MSFLPEGYVEPASGSEKYYKLKQGENTFRILGPSVVGNMGWTMVNGKKKPIRKRVTDNFEVGEVDLETLKHFISFPVWNYDKKKVQVAEFTQSGIRKAIVGYANKASWGDPTQYDIVIVREGEGMDTEYHVTPEPKSSLSQDAAEAWENVKKNFDLNRIFSGGDPFEPLQAKAADEINIDDIPFK